MGEEPDQPTASTIIEAVDHARIDATLAPSLEAATRIDRFVILEKLGEGGMGQVYAAYDTLLDRKVAMKVMRPGRTGPDGRTRLLREAQAMARLRHPNVVTVLEVGALDDGIFLALELVDGVTLKTWLRACRRAWPEVVASFVEAGRGLAAAHAAGLVHRDVKPDNILRATTGQVLITDFGVASMSASSAPDAPGIEDTWSGLRVGTPAYMAPEQFEGDTPDPRADQFAFCVALWEGVFGERPYEPSSPVGARRWRATPPQARVPAWLVAALRRGFAEDPSRRWPSIDALLEELTRRRGFRRWGGPATVAGALAIGAVAVVAALRRPAATPPCEDPRALLADVWDPAAAAALARGFEQAGGAALVPRVRAHLDQWTASWVAHRTHACVATRVHGDRTDLMWRASTRCLDRRLVQLRAIVRELQVVQRDELGRAAETAATLPDLQHCEDEAQLAAMAALPADPALRERIQALERELARAAALERSGRFPAALDAARPIVERAADTRYLPIRAEAMAMVGRLRAQVGAHDDGIALLRDAARIASAGDADDVAAAALVELVWATADAGRGSEALAVAAVARPVVERVRDPALDALLAARIAEAKLVAGEIEGAATELERALGLVESALGRTHYQAAQVRNRLGAVEERLNRPARARAQYREALAIATAALGPAHPATAITRANLCYLDAQEGQRDTAAACYEAVITTLEAALGLHHPQVAWALNDAGLVARSRGRLADARAAWERAIAIYDLARGRSTDLAWPLVNLAALALDAGDDERAATLCRRALAAVEDAPAVADDARFEPLVCLGAALAERSPVEAIELLERASRMDEAHRTQTSRGASQFALARAHAARGDTRRAKAAAREALAAFAQTDTERAALVRWAERRRIALE